MNTTEIKRALEAALLCTPEPLSMTQLRRLFDDEFSAELLRPLLDEIVLDWAEHPVELVSVASGWRFQSRPEYAVFINRLTPEKAPRYSRAVMETLAIIAYRQPATRGDIEEIRGVSVSSQIIKTLEERGWIDVIGHKEVPGRPALFGTTRQFLDDMGLRSIKELPPIDEMGDGTAVDFFNQQTGDETEAEPESADPGASGGDGSADGAAADGAAADRPAMTGAPDESVIGEAGPIDESGEAGETGMAGETESDSDSDGGSAPEFAGGPDFAGEVGMANEADVAGDRDAADEDGLNGATEGGGETDGPRGAEAADQPDEPVIGDRARSLVSDDGSADGQISSQAGLVTALLAGADVASGVADEDDETGKALSVSEIEADVPVVADESMAPVETDHGAGVQSAPEAASASEAEPAAEMEPAAETESPAETEPTAETEARFEAGAGAESAHEPDADATRSTETETDTETETETVVGSASLPADDEDPEMARQVGFDVIQDALSEAVMLPGEEPQITEEPLRPESLQTGSDSEDAGDEPAVSDETEPDNEPETLENTMESK